MTRDVSSVVSVYVNSSYEFAFSRLGNAYKFVMSQGQGYTVIDYLMTMFTGAVQNNLTAYGVAPLTAGVLKISQAGVAGLDTN